MPSLFEPVAKDVFCEEMKVTEMESGFEMMGSGKKGCTAQHSNVVCSKGGGGCDLEPSQYPHLCNACGVAF